MGMGGGGKQQAAAVPAAKPQRTQSVQAEDIQVGGDDAAASTVSNGKRSLVRPVSSSLGMI